MLNKAVKPTDQTPIKGLSISSAQSSTYSEFKADSEDTISDIQEEEDNGLTLALSQSEVEPKDCKTMSHTLTIKDTAPAENISFENNYINLFEELSVIGSGGFGTVFKMKHRFDEHIYAVK
ncbi:unnamed protein product [Oppiella nova]|uniref:Protein kinase domain-containing protein n=1 Tax=Oppiella nova TaxID=334625 RepID=A0A7R9QLX3_9ACAR|nr:unnamed protein product [Oppiella nova]CAG2168207.1 unnamed protein product [Oppiella nova]